MRTLLYHVTEVGLLLDHFGVDEYGPIVRDIQRK